MDLEDLCKLVKKTRSNVVFNPYNYYYQAMYYTITNVFRTSDDVFSPCLKNTNPHTLLFVYL
jgi:hypothetical protein